MKDPGKLFNPYVYTVLPCDIVQESCLESWRKENKLIFIDLIQYIISSDYSIWLISEGFYFIADENKVRKTLSILIRITNTVHWELQLWMQISNVVNSFHGISFLWLFLLTSRAAFHLVLHGCLKCTVVGFKNYIWICISYSRMSKVFFSSNPSAILHFILMSVID